jgi:hypothetical protein
MIVLLCGVMLSILVGLSKAFKVEQNNMEIAEEWLPFSNWIAFPDGSILLFRQSDSHSTAIRSELPLSVDQAIQLITSNLKEFGFTEIQFHSKDHQGFSFMSHDSVVTGVVERASNNNVVILLNAQSIGGGRRGDYGIDDSLK